MDFYYNILIQHNGMDHIKQEQVKSFGAIEIYCNFYLFIPLCYI